jgi:hypothetical protein
MKNQFISKRGFVHFTHEAMLFDAHNLSFPSERLFEDNGVYVQKSFIMQTERETAIVYFVSGTNGDEFGQFTTAEKAIEKARAMAQLSEKERGKFDE